MFDRDSCAVAGVAKVFFLVHGVPPDFQELRVFQAMAVNKNEVWFVLVVGRNQFVLPFFPVEYIMLDYCEFVHCGVCRCGGVGWFVSSGCVEGRGCGLCSLERSEWMGQVMECWSEFGRGSWLFGFLSGWFS